MPHHVYFAGFEGRPGGSITLGGTEAHHALRVKRLEVGDALVISNGRGTVAECRVSSAAKVRDEWTLTFNIEGVERAEPVRPRVRVLAAAAKGAALEEMIDGLTQVGAAAWGPLMTARTVVDPRPGKLERLERVALEALKQSGRAWLMTIEDRASFGAALAGGQRVVLADASGGPYEASGAAEITLLIGPEGGWSPEELAKARSAGATIAGFGPHIMRIETAAVAAAAVVLHAESRHGQAV